MTSLVRREQPAPAVARLVLNRPERRNAQNPQMLYDLDAAFGDCARDDSIKVIVLSGAGPDFSSGHDVDERESTIPADPVATFGAGLGAPGVEGRHAFECEAYRGLCRRWRDLPKPTIGQAHGRSIAGGLMLLWPMDLIIASETATFADPVVAFGLNGVEYFSHVWEVGHRKAKEMLFTGAPLTAGEALALGMVNHVVADDDLDEFTVDLARRIAAMPAYGLRLAKASVNASLDAQGYESAVSAGFVQHMLGHASNLAQYGDIINPDGADLIRQLARREQYP
ncbi:enoyl-CoA hydratase [Gordonia lacunae]|uniref:Enoyl-CoA hydratase n=1 Tax=Gordonia lacunae TaxID=417102 RepID=A0A243QCE7_9ACTN|nr:enoyl-CoA hydratase [Gordonia lacunae]OUC79401.1 enoyl-CoA hydratase [Gordonia lacunae]